MAKAISTERMKALDRIAIEQYGIPSLILMENAGRGIVDLAEKIIQRNPKKILVVCGKGNNGGDGFVAARHLINRGHQVQVIVLAEAADLKDDPKLNHDILKRMHVPVLPITTGRKVARLKGLAQKSNLILDGIFGIGLTRPVGGLYYDVISILNHSGKPILAIDIPSGLNSDSGEELGIAIRAKATGTLGAAKRGLFIKDGPKCSGEITVIDISIPKKLLS